MADLSIEDFQIQPTQMINCCTSETIFGGLRSVQVLHLFFLMLTTENYLLNIFMMHFIFSP